MDPPPPPHHHQVAASVTTPQNQTQQPPKCSPSKPQLPRGTAIQFEHATSGHLQQLLQQPPEHQQQPQGSCISQSQLFQQQQPHQQSQYFQQHLQPIFPLEAPERQRQAQSGALGSPRGVESHLSQSLAVGSHFQGFQHHQHNQQQHQFHQLPVQQQIQQIQHIQIQQQARQSQQLQQQQQLQQPEHQPHLHHQPYSGEQRGHLQTSRGSIPGSDPPSISPQVQAATAQIESEPFRQSSISAVQEDQSGVLPANQSGVLPAKQLLRELVAGQLASTNTQQSSADTLQSPSEPYQIQLSKVESCEQLHVAVGGAPRTLVSSVAEQQRQAFLLKMAGQVASQSPRHVPAGGGAVTTTLCLEQAGRANCVSSSSQSGYGGPATTARGDRDCIDELGAPVLSPQLTGSLRPIRSTSASQSSPNDLLMAVTNSVEKILDAEARILRSLVDEAPAATRKFGGSGSSSAPPIVTNTNTLTQGGGDRDSPHTIEALLEFCGSASASALSALQTKINGLPQYRPFSGSCFIQRMALENMELMNEILNPQ